MNRLTQQTTGYRSYLLRLWCEQQDGNPVWRASLENVQSGQQHGFAGLEELLAYLMAQISADTNQVNDET